MIDPSSPASVSGVSHMDALPSGTRLAEFEILSLLGVGGFGMVYKAFDHSLHRAVAIKEFMPSALAGRAQGQSLWVRSSSDQHTFLTGLASFVDEARLLAQFDHPSLVKVFRFWEANNTAYMVMPLYSGMTFKQARAQMRTPPPEIWLRRLLWSVLGALRVLHDGKTLHRDISPDNIFLQDNGPPVLLDLGAARHAINDQDRKHTAVLKVNYAPIEQYSEGDEEFRQGPWSDLYSLAAVVHGCLCNDTPLPATLRTIRDRMVPFPRVAKTVKRQFGVEYSAPFVAAITQSLSLRPQDRPQNIDAFLQIMEMTSPPGGVEHFDFRADLGDLWVDPPGQPGSGEVSRTVDVISAANPVTGIHEPRSPAGVIGVPEDHAVPRNGVHTVRMDPGDTVFIEAGDTVAAEDSRLDAAVPVPVSESSARPVARLAPDPDQAGRGVRRPVKAAPSRRYSPVVWLAVAALVVMVAAAGLRWVQKAPQPKDDIITEMAEPSAPVAAPAALVDAAASVALPPLAVPAVASGRVASAETVASAATVARPVAPRGTSRGIAAEPVPAPSVVQEGQLSEPPVAAGVPRPRPAAGRIVSPQEACAGTNFLARPMCIHRECQKPSQMAQPICVENRRRYEADEERQRQNPN